MPFRVGRAGVMSMSGFLKHIAIWRPFDNGNLKIVFGLHNGILQNLNWIQTKRDSTCQKDATIGTLFLRRVDVVNPSGIEKSLRGDDMFIRIEKASCWLKRFDWAGPSANSCGDNVKNLIFWMAFRIESNVDVEWCSSSTKFALL